MKGSAPLCLGKEYIPSNWAENTLNAALTASLSPDVDSRSKRAAHDAAFADFAAAELILMAHAFVGWTDPARLRIML